MTEPNPDDYRKLKAAMRDSNRAYDAAKDDKSRHTAGLNLLRACMQYLMRDQDVLDECLRCCNRLTRPTWYPTWARLGAGDGVPSGLFSTNNFAAKFWGILPAAPTRGQAWSPNCFRLFRRQQIPENYKIKGVWTPYPLI
jgi:hypothetical protein